MKYAVSKGLNIAINTRVDDGAANGGWRNTLKFNPTTKYGAYSYEEACIQPLADALGRSMEATTEVAFTLQGEMGATAMYYPQEWIGVIERTRQRIVEAADMDGTLVNTSRIEIGVGITNLLLYLFLLIF